MSRLHNFAEVDARSSVLRKFESTALPVAREGGSVLNKLLVSDSYGSVDCLRAARQQYNQRSLGFYSFYSY